MPPQAARPNIVWLVTDHHIFQHHRTLGRVPGGLATYDRLCREGISFNRARSICPVCTPARASMLTGQYPHNHGMTQNEGWLGSRLEFDPETHLFNHELQQVGYRVGYFGKWHCGRERGPQDFGFEGWSMTGYGYPYRTEEYAEYLREKGLPQAEVQVEWHETDTSKVGKRIQLSTDANELSHMSSAGRLTTPAETHEAYFLSHLASRWLESAAGGDQPFCLRIDTWGPHQPYFVGAPFADTIDPRSIPEYPSFRDEMADKPASYQSYLALRRKYAKRQLTWEQWQPIIARAYEHSRLVDAALGRVLDTLDRLGLADNTMVVYTADHGDAIGSHGGLFDKGWLMTEEVCRIPLAVRWPKQILASVVSDRLVTNMDAVPTVLEAAGAEVPAEMDGQSLIGLAANPRSAPWRERLMLEQHGHDGTPAFQRMLLEGNYKYIAHLNDMDQLYDLERDPFELNNLANDPGTQELLKSLRARLIETMDATHDNSAESDTLRKQIG